MKLEIKVGPDLGAKLINDLIKKCVCDEGYRSEAALARALGIGPHKLSRWKNGLYPVSPEMITLSFILKSMKLVDVKSVLESKSAWLIVATGLV